ncbi:hypothetical protein D030_3676B, partial [Vibrio parahaemolyticus AQ3810]
RHRLYRIDTLLSSNSIA